MLLLCTVAEVDEARGWVRLECHCVSHDGREVLTADIRGFPGRFEE